MLQKFIQAAIITGLLQLVLNLSPPKASTSVNMNLSQVLSMLAVD
ncbi:MULTISPECIES: hypothetical protein [Planktothricoides]|jgi:hypothetical protein|uniref:Uncharacterized protein n=1 Tax=Planktothricoides raciborskii GIHE-MW2 TaxID=2792601 RepID=A0AAU8JBD7_9CYAN|nr:MULTISPECIES: hypothetical protein [Planktothricoides]